MRPFDADLTQITWLKALGTTEFRRVLRRSPCLSTRLSITLAKTVHIWHLHHQQFQSECLDTTP